MQSKSNKAKALQGTLHPSRIKTYTPGEIGEPMFKLDAGEQRIYNRIREHLHIHKAGKQVDEIYLSIAARAIGHLLHNADLLSKDGAVMVHPNGARQVSAEWTAFKQGFELFLELSKTLGLDPKSRLTLEYFSNGSQEEEDEIAKLLKMN
jgi:phage terminase small subunit